MYSQKSVVLIVGATGLIGSGIAKEFAKVLCEKSKLIVTSRSKERLHELKESLKKINPNIVVRGLIWDLDNPNTDQYRKDLEAINQNCTKCKNAILVLNAADKGNLSHDIVEIGKNLAYFQKILNINLMSTLATTSAFYDVFAQYAQNKIIVNTTGNADSQNAIASFGYYQTGMSARKMALNILAKEKTDIKILHYVPGIVPGPGYDQIIKETFNPQLKKMFENFKNMAMTGDHVGKVLVDYIGKNEFESTAFVVATQGDAPIPFAGIPRPNNQ